MSHAFKSVQFFNLGLFLTSVAVADGDIHAVFQCSAMHAAHGDASRVVAVVERRDEHLGRALKLLGGGNHLDYLVEQILNVVGRCLPVFCHPAVFGRTVHYREVELVFGGIEGEHQIEHHFVDFLRTTVGFVHLVHHHNGFQPQLQCLLKHEAGLGHGALKGVDEQQAAVGHVEHTLHLTAEVGVARGVENIYLSTFPVDRNVF